MPGLLHTRHLIHVNPWGVSIILACYRWGTWVAEGTRNVFKVMKGRHDEVRPIWVQILGSFHYMTLTLMTPVCTQVLHWGVLKQPCCTLSRVGTGEERRLEKLEWILLFTQLTAWGGIWAQELCISVCLSEWFYNGGSEACGGGGRGVTISVPLRTLKHPPNEWTPFL